MNGIPERVHELYWNKDYNCTRTMLLCLGEAFNVPILPQTLQAATGMHGAGRFRAQCGLVEGALMFTGILGAKLGLTDRHSAELCRLFARDFTESFGSLLCRDLRPGGFQPSDPPHACEELTVRAVSFALGYLNAAKARSWRV